MTGEETKIMPRGGVERNWWEISMIYRRKLKALQKASQAVLDEADSIHDNDRPPQKYRAPYGALADLRKVLATIDEWPKGSR